MGDRHDLQEGKQGVPFCAPVNAQVTPLKDCT